MKYKLYYIKDQNNVYYNEIRGIRFDHQYNQIPDYAEYIQKEYDSNTDGIIDLFFSENGNHINFAKYKTNETFTDIVEITEQELQSNPRYTEHQNKKIIQEALIVSKHNAAINAQIAELQALKIERPELGTIIDAQILELQGQLL